MLLGITGTDGAGKGAVVDYLLKEKGFKHYSARDILLTELEKAGRETTRQDLRLMGNEMRAKHGKDFVVSYYLAKYTEEKPENTAIESIRVTAEVETLKANDGVLLGIDADPNIRYKRIRGRKSSSDQISFEQFIEQEKLEMDDPDANGMQKAKVMKMADYTIENNGTLEELQQKIEEFLIKFNAVQS